MNYKQTIEYLFSSLPMFQRVGDAAIKKDLTNIRLLCNMLDQPQESFPTIHVAGTNGKGSVSHMLASIFQAKGLKVGLYTSPHYIDFRERIKINGQVITQHEVVRFVETYQHKWDAIQPSFFEITVAMAFHFFRNEKVDIAIIETGLGGRLDSTNIITPLLSVITNIGFDHMQMLGNTLPAIASEKAGIIKPNIPVCIGEWQKETTTIFKEKARKEQAPIHFASRHLSLKKTKVMNGKLHFAVTSRSGHWIPDVHSDLVGPYQAKNICTVLESIWCWNKYYPELYISDKLIKKGLANVVGTTNMMGRWMIIQRSPLVITDAAHNDHGMRAMLPQLLDTPAQRRHFVLGFVSDKDISKILRLFPKEASYYWCAPNIPRAKPVNEVQQEGIRFGLKGEGCKNVGLAYAAALRSANKADLIFVGGSSYVVGDFLAGLQAIK